MLLGSLRAALIGAICLFTAAQSTAVLAAETFPSRPITILVPFAAGGSSDVVMRLVSRQVSESIGRPIIIENKPGGAGNTAALVIKNAAPDGYTLMMGHTGSHAINATLYPDLKFDPVRDFMPIAPLISFNNVLIVPQESPVKSAAELVALAKSKPEGLTYGSQGVGTGGHLLGIILAKRTGIQLVHVPYRGGAPAIADLLGGQVQVIFDVLSESIEFIRAGRLRPLAVTTAVRSEALPDLPTVGDFLPGYETSAWFGVGAPRNTPAAIIDKLNKEINAGLADPRIKARFADLGAAVFMGSPTDFGKFMSEETEKWGKVVKFAGMKPQ